MAFLFHDLTKKNTNKTSKTKKHKTNTQPHTNSRNIDMVITDLCVFEIDRKAGQMRLIELAPGVTLDDVKAKTEASFSS